MEINKIKPLSSRCVIRHHQRVLQENMPLNGNFNTLSLAKFSVVDTRYELFMQFINVLKAESTQF